MSILRTPFLVIIYILITLTFAGWIAKILVFNVFDKLCRFSKNARTYNTPMFTTSFISDTGIHNCTHMT